MTANRRRYVFLLVFAGAIGASVLLVQSIGSRSPARTAPTETASRSTATGADDVHLRKPKAAHLAGQTGVQPLADSRTPLKDRFAELQTLANAGNVPAARRLYHDLNLCALLASVDTDNSRLADELLGADVGKMDNLQLHDYQTQLEAIEARGANMQKLHTLCDGTSRQMFDALVPSLRQAAELGDADARACYLSRGPNLDMRAFLQHPEFLEEYRSSADGMIKAGLASGDWKVVDLLRNAYQSGAQSLLAGVVGSDTLQYYRYLKLYRLGAEAQRADELDGQLKAAAAKLAPAQTADADAWAQATLRQNFSGSSTETTVTGWDPCSFAYDLAEP
jgi:hypothetical protein